MVPYQQDHVGLARGEVHGPILRGVGGFGDVVDFVGQGAKIGGAGVRDEPLGVGLFAALHALNDFEQA